MCHINLVFKKDMVPDKKLAKYMNIVSFYSFQSNSDGEGYLAFDNDEMRTGKSLGKIRYGLPSYLLMTHQRFTTSGKGVDNVHPHETQDLVVMHNGVISTLGDDKKSDTSYYADMLQELYIEHQDVTKAVRALALKTRGTYSVVVVEKASSKVFYYKEKSTNMFMTSNDKYLIMSTNENNVKFAKFWFKIKQKVKEVEELYIYDVLNKFKKLRKFEEASYSYAGGYSGGYTGYGKSSHHGFGDTRGSSWEDDYHYNGLVATDTNWVKDDRPSIDDKLPEKLPEKSAEDKAIAIVKKEMDGD